MRSIMVISHLISTSFVRNPLRVPPCSCVYPSLKDAVTEKCKCAHTKVVENQCGSIGLVFNHGFVVIF